ncbi:MAG: ABC transporter permease [Thauera sp.]
MTLAAVALGVAGLVLAGGFVKDIFFQLGEAIIHSQTGHVQVFQQGFLERGTRQPERFLIEAPQTIASTLESLPGVTEVAARLNFSGLLNNGRRDLAIIGEGIEADKEARLGSYLKLIAGRQLGSDDAFGMLVGQGVAASLGLTVGSIATALVNTGDGALNTADFEVVGIFQSFSKDFDARAVRIPLEAAQTLMLTNGANLIVISLASTAQTDATLLHLFRLMPSGLEARTWYQLSDFYEKAVQLYERQFGVLQLIILFMILLSVANTVNMGVAERLGEFGTLQALGNGRKQVFRLVVLENVLLGAIGAAGGLILGLLAAEIISTIGIPMPAPPNSNQGYTAYIQPDFRTSLAAVAIGFSSAALASLLPAWRVSRTPIVDALRQSI